MNIDTQCSMILKALNSGKRLTPLDGLRVAGSMKLSSRVGEIERDYGIKIHREWIKRNGKRMKVYWL